jgi:crotonobetainyl-CoA:carnitine CoA-transferase CaiB-like acyl-CoA transferase
MEYLKGIRVLDLTAAVAGTSATMVLADLGADVVKIEPPQGEHYRDPAEGALLLTHNRNKHDLALDLRTSEGQDIALKLASRSDVMVENFIPGTVKRFGLDYETVSRLNPGIIYCSVSGFGQEGPYSQRPAYDPLVQAMSGIMIATGEPKGKPCRQQTSLVDLSSGMYAVIAILAAVIERGKTGKGCRIDISLLDSAIFAMNYHLAHYSLSGKLPRRLGSGSEPWVPYGAFDTKDRPVWIGVSSNKFWAAFCDALGLDDLMSDSRYEAEEGRRQHRDELDAKVEKICIQYSSSKLESVLVKAGVPCSRLATVAELEQNPQVQLRELIEQWDYPGKGQVKIVKTPIMIDGHLPKTKTKAPQLGEHTTEILADLGYTERQIEELLSRGIVVRA